MLISETGIISLSTMFLAFLSAALGVAYKSKCSHMKCCCIEVDRDIKSELKEDMAQLGKHEVSRAASQINLNETRKSFEFRRNSMPTRSENVINQV